MHPIRRRLVVAAVFAPAASTALAQPKEPVELRDYRPVKPAQPVDTGNRIEVLEFFQYSCPHCATFDVELEPWRRKLPADVQYRRLPVAFNAATVNHVKIYYALLQLNKVDELHRKVFDAYHGQRRRLLDPNEIADFMAANGVDRKLWLDAFNSFSVATQTNRAAQVWNAYKLDGTPAVAIDGKWMTAPSMVGSRAGALPVMDFLIDRARKERGRK
ncbi:MAG: thiol:disulfide interchange protein DsbA/DsbL [Burkholderiaceae bacterium]|nr:thiol:disulfide interchange protein DsbA/DsbL [Burkholderiaceae bacterium]